MRNNKKIIVLAILVWLICGSPSAATTSKKINKENYSAQTGLSSEDKELKTGSMSLGRFSGQVVYDKEKDYYFLELRGARFPFKASPLQIKDILLEAPGANELEKNTALLYGIVGPKVSQTTILVNPAEEDEVKPAFNDIQRYIKIINRRKFGGIAYTNPLGKLQKSPGKDSQIKTIGDATSKAPMIQLKGPQSGATQTRVLVAGNGKIIVEGKTYEDLYKAADFIGITLLKMLCGSPSCPDASACATGGKCGCGKK